MREIANNGPVTAAMVVYEDFLVRIESKHGGRQRDEGPKTSTRLDTR
jgi:hypothetical protein